MTHDPGDKNARSRKGLNLSDLRLWKFFTQDIDPLREEDWSALEEAVAPDGTRRDPVALVERIVPDAVRAQVRPAVNQPPQLDRRTADKLRKGKMDIEARLDLHGYSQEQAYSALQDFIPKCQAQAKRCVLVITGKGRSGDGVLRQKVPQWLMEGALAGIVLKISPAIPKDGGEGALYVYLRRIRA